MLESPGELQDLAQLDRAERGGAVRAHVDAARERVREGQRRGVSPVSLLRFLAAETDRLLRGLYRCADVPDASMLSLVALGGYGRGELFPHSDLDLLVLQHDPEDEEVAARVVEHVVYPLWDAGLSVGHAVRGIDETFDLAAEDLTARTALLDARLLCGDEGPFHALQAGGLRRFFGPQRVQEFVAALHAERARRHHRFGVTEYLLEPNVKQSKGGLRDLNTAVWAASARFGVAELERFVEIGVGTPRQVKELSEAQRFLQRLRLAMHLEASRAQDHLSFELQERLAPRLYPEVELPGIKRGTPAVEPAVERLMRAFYRHAHAVVRESEAVLERCRLAGTGPKQGGRRATDRDGEHFVITGRRISTVEPARFWEEPAEIVRAFSVALKHGVSLDRATQDAIAEAVAAPSSSQLAADEAAAELFIEMLCDPEREELGGALEEMHHLGVLATLIPEFEACTGRIQHDLYHVYTVDLHSLYVVALLKAWRRGEQAQDFATPVAVTTQLPRLEALMLAALLHDVGKPLGSGHAAKGARLAQGVAARLGLDVEVQKEVGFLVRNHLVMAHLSQRRDLTDPAVITSFAEQVGTVDRLRHLYLLTAADTAMTAPGNLTEWKASLLEELYIKTYRLLTHGREDRDHERLEERRDAVELALRRRRGPQGGRIVDRVPDELLSGFEVPDLVHHLGIALDLEREDASVRIGTRAREGGAVELTVCCPDSPGRLATITGVLLLNRVEVLAAQVFTLEPASPGGQRIVLDIFRVEPQSGEAAEERLWARLAAMLEQAVCGELDVAGRVTQRTRPSRLRAKVLPRVPTGVAVDNDASDRLTVLEVQAPDRPGALYAITSALSELGLVIHLSKVASEAGRVVDVFYVSEGESGGKVTGDRRLEEVQEGVFAAISGPGESEG